MAESEEIIKQYRRILNRCPLFSLLDDNELRYALELFDADPVFFKKGELIHFAGNTLNRFGAVLSGRIHVCSDDIEGNRVIMASVLPGGTFGESLCFLKIKEAPCFIMAADNSYVLMLSTEKLYPAAPGETDIKIQKCFTSMIASRALQMNSRIQVLSKPTIRKKLIFLFTELYHENKANTFTLPFDRNDMASYIGVNRSALSRELSNMKKDGLIDFYKDTVKIIGFKEEDQ